MEIAQKSRGFIANLWATLKNKAYWESADSPQAAVRRNDDQGRFIGIS